MSTEAERIECSVASSAAGAEGPPVGAFRMAHEGRLLTIADAIGIHAQTTGAAHRALQTFLEPLRIFPESAEALRTAIHAAFDSANAVVGTGEELHGIATAPDTVALASGPKSPKRGSIWRSTRLKVLKMRVVCSSPTWAHAAGT